MKGISCSNRNAEEKVRESAKEGREGDREKKKEKETKRERESTSDEAAVCTVCDIYYREISREAEKRVEQRN